MGSNGVHHLLGQVFNENQRGDKNVCLSYIRTKTGVIVVITQLFDEIAAQLNPELRTRCIQGISRLGQRVLVLGFQHHIHGLHHRFVVLTINRGNAAISGADLCEHLRTSS